MSAPAAAPHRTISQFCDHVCMYVRFRPDHEAITAELTAHLEDHKAAILETRPDMPLREAERRAVEAMGNPEELGRWLDSIHNPLLGWLQIWFVRAVVLAGVLMLLFSVPRLGTVAQCPGAVRPGRNRGGLPAGGFLDVGGLHLLHSPGGGVGLGR